MKPCFPRTVRFFATLTMLCIAANTHAADDAGNIFAKDNILQIMRRVDEWQTAHPVLKPQHRTWIRSAWYMGVMAAYKATRDPYFLNQVKNWGEQGQFQLGSEAASGANKMFPLSIWVDVFTETGNRAAIAPAIEWIDNPVEISPGGGKKDWFCQNGNCYADSLFGAPGFAALTKATGDKKYTGIMNAQFDRVLGDLFDKEAGLCYRDQRFTGQKTPNGKKVFWSRGNGWVVAATARVLEYLPENDPSRPKYVELLKTMAASLAKCQGADGLWRPNLGDAEQFPMPESSGTGFFCFALAWGVNNGILDRATYEPVVKRAWQGLVGVVTPEGKVQWGQGTGDRPVEVKQEDTQEYVTGAFLLAGSEMYKLDSNNNGPTKEAKL